MCSARAPRTASGSAPMPTCKVAPSPTTPATCRPIASASAGPDECFCWARRVWQRRGRIGGLDDRAALVGAHHRRVRRVRSTVVDLSDDDACAPHCSGEVLRGQGEVKRAGRRAAGDLDQGDVDAEGALGEHPRQVAVAAGHDVEQAAAVEPASRPSAAVREEPHILIGLASAAMGDAEEAPQIGHTAGGGAECLGEGQRLGAALTPDDCVPGLQQSRQVEHDAPFLSRAPRLSRRRDAAACDGLIVELTAVRPAGGGFTRNRVRRQDGGRDASAVSSARRCCPADTITA